MAVDYRTLPYYERDQPHLVRASGLPGTTRRVCFAMLNVVGSGKSIALRVRQVRSLNTHVEGFGSCWRTCRANQGCSCWTADFTA